MKPCRILLVDDDESTIEILRAVLLQRGHEVEFALDGANGLRMALDAPPDVAVVDVMMPEMNGWELVQRLRADSRLALVPVVFLTSKSSKSDRVKGFSLGADDYLQKPVDFEEVAVRVERAAERKRQLELQMGARAADGAAAPRGLQGRLEQIGLPSVLTMLEMERRTGVLLVTRAVDHASSRILLREGRIVRVESEIEPESASDETLYDMLTWQEGDFDFDTVEVECEDEVRQNTMSLLLEGARRLDMAVHEASS